MNGGTIEKRADDVLLVMSSLNMTIIFSNFPCPNLSHLLLFKATMLEMDRCANIRLTCDVQ